jgi:hypothetical protein
MKVANNSNNNNSNNNQGQEREDNTPLSAALKKVTAKAHNPSLEKGRSSRTEQKERRPPSPEVVNWTSHPVTHNCNKLTKKEAEEKGLGIPYGITHNARYWRRLERKVKEDEEKRSKRRREKENGGARKSKISSIVFKENCQRFSRIVDRV